MPLLADQTACPQCSQPVKAIKSSVGAQHASDRPAAAPVPVGWVLGIITLLLGILYALGAIPRTQREPAPINITVSPQLTNTLSAAGTMPGSTGASAAKPENSSPASPAPKAVPAPAGTRPTNPQPARRAAKQPTKARPTPSQIQKEPVNPRAEKTRLANPREGLSSPEDSPSRALTPREVLSAPEDRPSRALTPREVLSAPEDRPSRPTSPTEIPLDE